MSETTAPIVDATNLPPDVQPATPVNPTPTPSANEAGAQPQDPNDVVTPVTGPQAAPAASTAQAAPAASTAPARSSQPSGFRAGFAAGALPPSYHTDDNGQLVPDRAPVKPSFMGIIGSVLGGALRGASEGMAAEKGESGAAAAQRISTAADAKAREVAERNFQNKRAVQDDLLNHNLMTAKTVSLIQKSKIEQEDHDEVKKGWGLQDQETRRKMEANDQADRNSIASYNAELQHAGIKPIDTITKAQPSGVSGAIPEGETRTPTSVLGQMLTHATNLANGKLTATQNGGRGANNGVFIYKTADLDNPITQPFYYQVGTAIHNEDGTPNMEERVITITPNGKTTYRDVLAEIHQGMATTDAANKKMGADAQALQAKAALAQTQAKTEEAAGAGAASRAKAQKDQIEADNEKIINNPEGAGKTGEDYIKTLPASQQDMVRAIGQGRVQYSERQMFTKDGLPTPTLSMVMHAYPDYNVANARTWAKTDNEYRGSGATAKKIVSYNASMEHLQNLFDHTTGNGMFNPASKDYQDRTGDMSIIGREVGNAINQGVMTQGEGEDILKGISGAPTPALNRERIKNTITLLRQKMDQFQAKYDEGKPSAAVKVPKLINPKADASYNYIINDGKAPAVMPPNPNDVVRTGMVGNVKVFQLKDGRNVDAKGNPVSIPGQQ